MALHGRFRRLPSPERHIHALTSWLRCRFLPAAMRLGTLVSCGQVLLGEMEHIVPRHIRLTSHPGNAGKATVPLHWGAASAQLRGPVVASPAQPQQRNATGSHSGSYAIYRALAVATGALAPDHRPDLTDTAPAALIRPWAQWADPKKIVSLDPYGHLVGEVFADEIRAGIDARPTIAITTARIDL